MHIQTLRLKHYRGAQDLVLQLEPHLNVFVGMNGAGKSTILDATAILLSWLVNRIKGRSSVSGRPIDEEDIQNGTPTAELVITCCDQEHLASWHLAKTRKGYQSASGHSTLQQVTEMAKQYQLGLTESQGQINLPVFAYYPVNRAVLDIPLRIKEKHQFNILSAYEDAMTSGANFRTFFEWFREREDLENENRKYVGTLFPPDEGLFPDPQLEAVRLALKTFMPEFSNLTVRRNPLRMEVEKNGKRLQINQLSDGEKCLMAMMGDMARRMAIANPLLKNPLEGQGVILIDEIDLHLHPKWQRVVVSKLTEVFPHCQFLLSTHSPHVMTHVQPENLFLLSMSEQGLISVPVAESYGKSVERILEDLMGLDSTRPVEVQAQLSQIFELINSGKLTQAQDLILQVKTQIGEDPELVKATVLVKRKELIGK